ncbi:hypothetical protein [Pseudonocardia sp. HH130630-07]|uniref:hypothetical protein n=1 Tax=Pseudonocardia sp. HH130630-07 TaxID=1690815 RepID=UPI0012EA8F0E|nr:hypothetical protein [Pseudonocardia sp. HH130630-07]
MSPSAHAVLRSFDGDDLVVAADFGVAGRPAATVTELVAELKTECTVWETLPPPYGDETGMGGRQHVDRWVRDVRDGGRAVRAVLGFCRGSVYAGAMHREISRWQDPPLLILLDPDRPHRRMIVDYFGEMLVSRLEPMLSTTEIEEVVQAGRDVDGKAADPLELADGLGALCRQILPPACQRAGMVGERSTELARILASYLHWLAAATEFDVRPLWSSAIALNSGSEGYGLDAFDEADRAGLVAEVIQCETPYEDLMRSAEVARVIDDLLRR